MSMFSKSDSEPGSQMENFRGTSRPGSAPSIISADLKVTGDLTCGGDIQIDGTIEGDVRSKTVTVGENAHIHGSVIAESVNIRGTINGETRATSVIVSKSARVEGDIVHEQLSIEAGAWLDGYCRRMNAETAETAKTENKVATMPSREETRAPKQADKATA